MKLLRWLYYIIWSSLKWLFYEFPSLVFCTYLLQFNFRYYVHLFTMSVVWMFHKNDNENIKIGQCDQKWRFCALWVIFGCPWVLFFFSLFTVRQFLGKFLIYLWRFFVYSYVLLGAFLSKIGRFFSQNGWSHCL